MEDQSQELFFYFSLLSLLIFFSLFFSISESVFLSLNKVRLEHLREKKIKSAIRIGKMLDTKIKLINTILLGNNIVNVALASLCTSIAIRYWGEQSIAISAFILTIVLLIFGEITPKLLGVKYAEQLSPILAPPLQFFIYIFYPLATLLQSFSKWILKIVGVTMQEKTNHFTEEDIKNFIAMSHDDGIIEETEKQMLHKVFAFTDLTAKDVMTSRTNIVALSLSSSYEQILALSKKSHFSRFPVYETDIDSICGFVHVKDVLFWDNSTDFSLKKIMHKPIFVFESKKIAAVQQLLMEANEGMAIVLDEYSGTQGLLTMEDLAQEIFGDVNSKVTSNDFFEHQKNTQSLIVDGSMRLTELSNLLGIELTSKNYDTIAGFIIEKADSVPLLGMRCIYNGYKFIVYEMSFLRISKVKITSE
ncbi:MAG: hemolysin family protein [Treponemataceae bacterium]